MKVYQLLLLLAVLQIQWSSALEAEITKKVKAKREIFTCLFNIYYGDTCTFNTWCCQTNSTVSCSPNGKKKVARNVEMTLEDGTVITINKLKMGRNQDKIIGCKVTPAPKPPQPCGVENTPGRRISGGSETEANQYPWMVQLPMGCGGSLITDRLVLTAKHCVMARKKDWRGKMVKFSVHNRYDPRDYEEVAIKDYVMPDAKEIGHHDIAIIILEKPVDLSDNTIGTVCLPASADKDYRGKGATAMGWGMTAEGASNQNILKHVNLKVSQDQSRNFLYTDVPVVNGVPQDPCAGDSGGPLVYQEESGRWTIIGTVRGGGYDCRTGLINGKGSWSKVTDHLAWIKKVIGKSLI